MRKEILISIMVLSFISFSCKKDENKYDYRNQYIGKYLVKETVSCYGPCGSCYHERDTVIAVRYGMTDTTLNVLGRDVFLDDYGSYYAYHYSLSMRNDSIFSFSMNGGLGCGQYDTFKGKKISTRP